ncbi:MAG: GAF domain-containing protein [Opitutales bacterium]
MNTHPSAEHTAIDSLYRISSLVSGTDEPKEALELILREIIHVLQPSSASISLINPDTQRLEIEVSHGLPDDSSAFKPALGQGITGWTALHGRAVLVPDVSVDPRYVCIRPNVRSEMAVPIEDQGSVVGVVNVDSERVQAFDAHALKVLTLLTNEAGRVISRLWLIQQLRTKAHQLESLVKTSRDLVGQRSIDEVLEVLVREGRELMDCHGCALFLLTPDAKNLQLHNMICGHKKIESEISFPAEDSSMGAAIHRRKQIEVANLPFTEENAFSTIISRERLSSMLAVPVVFNEEVIGVLSACTSKPHRFHNDEKKVFGTLAGLGAIAIQNARLYARIFSTEESLRRNEKLTTLGMLAAEIAHEIRNPLTVIKLLFDSLNLEFSPEDARHKDIRVIGEKIDQLEDTVGRVLNFGRNREGMHAHHDLDELIEETLRLVRLKLHQQKIDVRYEPHPEGLPVTVNKGQIQQVVLNLILNATQVMPEGGCVQITTTRLDGHAGFAIRDNGPGMPETFQQEIFESFLTHRPEGTGLGLSISKRILRAHRGDIELLESSPEGSAFRFWLPLG